MTSRKAHIIHPASAIACIVAMGFTSLSHSECNTQDLRRFPMARNAAIDWADRRSIALAPSVLEEVASSYCAVALRTQARRSTSDEVLNDIASKVVPEYLDLELDEVAVMKSMSILLNNALGASGLIMKQPRRFAQLSIIYDSGVTRPDQLKIREELVPAVALFLVVEGHIEVEGIKSGMRVCHGSGNALAGVPLTISCKK